MCKLMAWKLNEGSTIFDSDRSHFVQCSPWLVCSRQPKTNKRFEELTEKLKKKTFQPKSCQCPHSLLQFPSPQSKTQWVHCSVYSGTMASCCQLQLWNFSQARTAWSPGVWDPHWGYPETTADTFQYHLVQSDSTSTKHGVSTEKLTHFQKFRISSPQADSLQTTLRKTIEGLLSLW